MRICMQTPHTHHHHITHTPTLAKFAKRLMREARPPRAMRATNDASRNDVPSPFTRDALDKWESRSDAHLQADRSTAAEAA